MLYRIIFLTYIGVSDYILYSFHWQMIPAKNIPSVYTNSRFAHIKHLLAIAHSWGYYSRTFLIVSQLFVSLTLMASKNILKNDSHR